MSRRPPLFPFVVVALGGTMVCCASVPAMAKNLRVVSGNAQVLMVNTLKVDNRIIDLKWIVPLPDYRPNKSSVLEETAVAALRNRIGDDTVTCEVKVRKLFRNFRVQKAFSGICYVGDSTRGLDLNGWLVRQGWASASSRGWGRPYTKEERAARAEKAGAWAFSKKFRWCCTGADSPGKSERQSPSGLDESRSRIAVEE
ncbi:MAG: hypothetical protein OXG96_14595 [Acidobacteria bacterium]|nr:hypothetical protein [Acidobacteriota bacterium]